MGEYKEPAPGSLFLLPIFFGLFGGIVAAIIADLRGASWVGLFFIGLVVQILVALGWALAYIYAWNSILSWFTT